MSVLKSTLAEIEPQQVATWLRIQGWWLHDAESDRHATYKKSQGPNGEERKFEVRLPLDRSLLDYETRLGAVLETLSEASHKPPDSVLAEVRAATSDIIQFRVLGPLVGRRSVPLDVGARLFARTRDVLLAAASAAREALPVYADPSSRPEASFLHRVEVSAAEEASFTVTVRAPVTPTLQTALVDDLEEEPIERRVTTTLALAAESARHAAERAFLGAGLDPFFEASRIGVSANLCEALAGFVDGESVTRLDLHFAWAPARPCASDTPTRIHITSDIADVLREGARQLRARVPRPDHVVSGVVLSVSPDEGDLASSEVTSRREVEAGRSPLPPCPPGRVCLACPIDGELRRVEAYVDRDDRPVVERAQREGKFVRCEGELRREGGGFVLDHVRHVRIVA